MKVKDNFILIKILDFCTKWHGDQKKKYTGEPYTVHLVDVANKYLEYNPRAIINVTAALLHDILEDTKCTEKDICDFLFGIVNPDENNEKLFLQEDIEYIVTIVQELTNQYTHKNYPEHNRKYRKILEAKRLWTISRPAQSIKYCDIIVNIRDIIDFDPEFARVYIPEKKYILQGMNKGNFDLYLETCHLIYVIGQELKEI